MNDKPITNTIPRNWHFIDDGEHPGAVNMARDEAISLCATRDSLPTLRVYKFHPPTITIGRFQRVPPVIECKISPGLKIEVVRRPTGGLAILHMNDFTYSVTMPVLESLTTVKGQYFELVALGIIKSMDRLGIDVSLCNRKNKLNPSSLWCIESAFGVDIDYEGRKFCGSAQKVFKHSVLQHGSLFLKDHSDLMIGIERLCTKYSFENSHYNTDTKERKNSSGYHNDFVALDSIVGEKVSWEQLKDAFYAGFEEGLEIRFEKRELSEKEKHVSKKLIDDKYKYLDWHVREGD